MAKPTVLSSLADRFATGGTVVSAWCGLPDPSISAILAQEDFDAITLDMQHGGHNEGSVLRGLAPVLAVGKPAIVRIPVGRFDMASRALDFGAEAVIAPMINSVADARAFASFMKYPPLGDRSWGPTYAFPRHGKGDFAEWLHDSNQRTLAFAIGCSALCLLFAYPIAYAIARRSGRFKLVAFGLILVPYLASLLIRVMSWQILLAQGGPLERMLRAAGLLHSPLTVLDSIPAVVIGTIAVYLPIAVIALAVVLDRIPPEVVEASQDLGASPSATFWTVIVPLSRPGIATAALLTAVPMLGELVIPALLGGDKGVLMGMAISQQYLATQKYALGSAMAVLVLVAVAVMVLVLVRLTRGFEEVSA